MRVIEEWIRGDTSLEGVDRALEGRRSSRGGREGDGGVDIGREATLRPRVVHHLRPLSMSVRYRSTASRSVSATPPILFLPGRMIIDSRIKRQE